ncbi:MAG: 16S rRNA (guanine(527)-N(7))-methyltransferase RsmG, partial [Solibacillus sp.]
LVDIGTGAGFPGLVIKIVYPHIHVTLVDSLKKRLVFLETVISELGLEKVECIHGRAEDLGKNKDFREKFEVCASRAVANLAVLSEYTLPFVKVNGYLIAL